MNAKVISIYAADTSGVCSALYELGGMTVVSEMCIRDRNDRRP